MDTDIFRVLEGRTHVADNDDALIWAVGSEKAQGQLVRDSKVNHW
jgi:hypothetical protein